MTLSEMILRLSQIIYRQEKHTDYDRVVEKSQLYRKLMTGEHMDSLMRRFERREDEALFRQRMEITQHITKTVAQNVEDVFHKIPRSNSIQKMIAYENNDMGKLKELNKALADFWASGSMEDYMAVRWIELNFIDPNAFLVVEWGDFDNSVQRAQPYPYEIYSDSAIMFEYVDNVLQYLVSETQRKTWVENEYMDETKSYSVFTMYGKDQTIQFVEVISEEEKKQIKRLFIRQKERLIDGYFRPNKDIEEYYRIVVYPAHNLGFVPAKRVGVKHDLATDGRTYVSPLDKGIPILMKMIKANSELDLTMALHTFPQKIQYASKCRERDCRDGHLLTGETCSKCNGLGFEIITSAQEAITLPMPKQKDDMLDLTNIVNYIYPPVDLVRFQKDYIDTLTYQVKESIFNTEIFSRQQVAETATGKNISLQNVYDALYPVATSYSKMWQFLVDTISSVMDIKDGLIAFYTFSKDFKLKSLTDLYLDLKSVGDARASEFIKGSIEDDIASVIYSESERDLLKYNVRKSWFPFNGKTPEQIAAIIAANNLVPEATKVFWANFGYIFDMIELEYSDKNIDFFYIPRAKQWEIISKKVQDIMDEIEKTSIQEPKLEINEPGSQADTSKAASNPDLLRETVGDSNQ